jgi:SnoaL-like domain
MMDEMVRVNSDDRQAIADLVRMERFHRDRRRWDELADDYIEDSRVKTTWFEGTGREFAAASRDMARRGRESIHLITPTEIRVDGDRALSESHAQIHNRSVIEGVEVDMVQYCRFFSRVARTRAGWRLASFDGIYHKDTIVPVDPNDRVPIDFDELGHLRPSYRIWAYAISLKGYEIGQDELGDDRPDLLEPFYAAAERWLAGGQ